MSEIERAIARLEFFKSVRGYWDNTADVAEIDTALRILHAELSRQENAPLTWNERINQMTIDEKVEWLNGSDYCRVTEIPIFECDAYKDCKECMRAFLNSPYTEGEKE